MRWNSNREELINKVKGLSSLTNDEKADLIALMSSNKKFGLLWEDSSEEPYDMLSSYVPVLEEVKEKQIISETSDAPNHIIIEGDNLHSLIALTYTHEGKIDVIYIDPPYNTGARDWRYNNEFVDNNDTFRHSKWLSWLNRRLLIAKRLLSDSGILVVTIDDYEVAQLRILLDEIFGPDNYLGTIVIRNNPSGRSTVRGVSVNHEYALLYAKSEYASLGHMKHNEEQKSRYSENDATGLYEWENFRKNGTDSDRKDRPKQHYPVYLNTDNNTLRIPELLWNEELRAYDILDSKEDNEVVIWPNTPEGTEKVWKYGLERARTILSEILVKKVKTGYELYRKKYLNVEGSLPRTWWDKPEYSARDNGTRTLTNIFGPNKVFDFPKAPEAVKDSLIAANLPKDGIVLDFFAGSGTTMHATMMLNAEDGGHRQCILATNNENNICEEVTYVRNKRVIQGYNNPKGQFVPGLSANSLRYYKIKFQVRPTTHREKRNLAESLADLICLKDSCFTERFQFGKLGLKDKSRLIRYFESQNSKLLFVYDTRVLPYVVEEIKGLSLNNGELKIYIFADGAYAYKDDFELVAKKIGLIPIPYAYSQSISRLLPEMEEKRIDDVDLTDTEISQIMGDLSDSESVER